MEKNWTSKTVRSGSALSKLSIVKFCDSPRSSRTSLRAVKFASSDIVRVVCWASVVKKGENRSTKSRKKDGGRERGGATVEAGVKRGPEECEMTANGSSIS